MLGAAMENVRVPSSFVRLPIIQGAQHKKRNVLSALGAIYIKNNCLVEQSAKLAALMEKSVHKKKYGKRNEQNGRNLRLTYDASGLTE